jgi:DMSO/TMAO reductase YedYZ molybdopterin-dependent catalytic subunit
LTARGTDWTLAALVSIAAATGGLTLFAGGGGDAWVFAVHGMVGLAIAGVLVWKLRRVLPRLANARLRDRRTGLGAAGLVLVASALLSGIAWSSGVTPDPGGYTLLAWHGTLGAGLMLIVAAHAGVRARAPSPGNPAGRRDFLRAGLVAAGGVAAWQLQKPAAGLVGLRGARRRFTGSYESGSFAGNAFPTTSWLADDPRALDADRWRLTIDGRVEHPLELSLAELGEPDELVATLDCTGGFHSTQRWSGVRVSRLLAGAGPLGDARHLRVISHTGYRWSFALADADRLLLASAVGGEPIDHGHGAPLRLVAPNRRGFEWVKWVVRLELSDEPDYGAVASTLWSSFTPAGRGA